MSAWGKNGSARSCDALLKRAEENDPRLTELVVLPLKKFGSKELVRLTKCLNGQNTHLRSLQASGHAIDDHTALEGLGKVLCSSPLESIAIGDSNMGDGGVCALCRGIEESLSSNEGKKKESGSSNNNGGLKTIDLSLKNVGKEGMLAIVRVLAKLQSLRSIDLSRNENIGPSFDFWEAACNTSASSPWLPIFPGLTHFDLSGCRLDAKSCTTLLRSMSMPIDNGAEGQQQQNTTTATTTTDTVKTTTPTRHLVLKLNSNNFSDPHQVRDMMKFLVTKGGAGNNTVSELYISACDIGDEGIEQIVNECCNNSIANINDNDDDDAKFRFLHTLDLSNNNVSSVASLADQLHKSSSSAATGDDYRHYFSNLRSLNLSGNPLGRNLLTAVGSNAEWISSLEELDLSHTCCEIDAAVDLIRRSNNIPNSSSSSSSSLKKLNLFGNNLGTDGFTELAKVLRGGHSSLEYLDLGGNGVAESGVVALVEALMNVTDTVTDTENEEKEELTTTTPTKNNRLRVLVVGGNSGGSALEKVAKEAEKMYPNLDIARDKPKRNNNGGGMMNGGVFNNTPGTTWMS